MSDNERELGELNAKMDSVLKSIDELKSTLEKNYVQKTSFDDLKQRVDKIENAPHKWIMTTISVLSFVASLAVGVIALVIK